MQQFDERFDRLELCQFNYCILEYGEGMGNLGFMRWGCIFIYMILMVEWGRISWFDLKYLMKERDRYIAKEYSKMEFLI